MAIRFRTPLVLALLAAACGTTPASYGARTEAVDAHVANEWRMAETADAAHEHAIAVGHAAHAMPSARATDIVHPMLPVERLVDAHIDFLASDDMGGRETGTVHSQLTGQYVASVFRAAGLTPGAEDGSYLQSYPMSAQRTLLDATRMDVTSADGAVTSPLELFDDYLVRGLGTTGAELSAGVVFAGYGIVSEADGVDEYAGLDVAGKWALVFDGRPPERQDLRRHSNWRSKRSAAQEAGAVGLLLVADESADSGARYLDSLEDTMRHPRMSVERDGDSEQAAWPMVWMRSHAVNAVTGAAGLDMAAELAARVEQIVPGRPLDGVTVALTAPVEKDTTHAYNILGLLEGKDPEVAHETIVITAHNDHVGIMRDGRINNGADDNASGTTTLLVAAQLMAAAPRPRRSVLFLSVSGEEKGLLGSEWWVNHPTIPLEDCIGNINIDMVGRNDPTAVGVTPSPEHQDYNTMVTRAVELGQEVGIDVGYTVPAMDGGDELVDEYYRRSDHYNFAEQGMPVAFFFSGVHEDYHRPTDTLEKIDRNKLRLMVGLVSRLITDIANAEDRPFEFADGE
ncbi:MAG: M28 family peptidase [Planctomycetota bacterium]